MKEWKISFDQTWNFLLWFLVPLIAGALLATQIPQPAVGIIYLDQAINGYSARDILRQIEYAREDNDIRAVVLVLESPGGTVADTEAVYLELAKLRAEKPVVSSVNTMAASGAYYLAVGSDYIFCKPTSMVGNVGVIGYLPPAPGIYEGIISTGPYKLFGARQDEYIRQTEMIRQGFAEAVRLGRGDKLKIEMDEVLTGELWPGTEAVRLGIVDALGAQSDAIAKAAELAGIHNQKTVKVAELAGIIPGQYPFFIETPEGLILPYPKEAGLYLLYIPPLTVQE
jgi:protease-4